MKQILLVLLCLFLFNACGTKRQYFEPEVIEKKLSYDEKLSSSIQDNNSNFASLANNQVISADGVIENFKLEKGYTLLRHEADEFFMADDNGNLKIVDQEGQEFFSHKFDAAVLAIGTRGDDLALVLADNTIVFYNRSLGLRFHQTLAQAPAQDSRVATPYILESIVVYPTLDGKLVILDKINLKIIRNILVGSEDFFNNIIFLKIIDDKMFASSAKRVLIVSPQETYTLNEEIKNISLDDENVFIFTKDGTIIKTDFRLKELARKKFNFAIFNESEIYNKHLFIFEKTGYLIESDLNLQNIKIYSLKDAVDEKTFMKEGKFYYSNKILNLW